MRRSTRGRSRIKADRKKRVLIMPGKPSDVRRVGLKQGRDHGVARFADVEPEDLWRSLLQHAHSNEVLVSSGQNVSAGAGEIPEQPIRRAGLRESSDVFGTGKQFGKRQ